MHMHPKAESIARRIIAAPAIHSNCRQSISEMKIISSTSKDAVLINHLKMI